MSKNVVGEIIQILKSVLTQAKDVINFAQPRQMIENIHSLHLEYPEDVKIIKKTLDSDDVSETKIIEIVYFTFYLRTYFWFMICQFNLDMSEGLFYCWREGDSYLSSKSLYLPPNWPRLALLPLTSLHRSYNFQISKPI